MRIVIDTNVFVSALLTADGNAALLLRLWRFQPGTFDVVVSDTILDEIIAVLVRLKVKRSKVRRLISLIRRRAILVNPQQRLHVVADEADNRFLECAVEGKAHCIVSGDHHLLELGTYEQVSILSPRQFLSRFAHP